VQAGFQRADLPDNRWHLGLQRPAPQQQVRSFVHLNSVNHRVDLAGLRRAYCVDELVFSSR
jgi:hypothetical protein